MVFFSLDTVCRADRESSGSGIGSGDGNIDAMQMVCVAEQFMNRATEIENICGSTDLSNVSRAIIHTDAHMHTSMYVRVQHESIIMSHILQVDICGREGCDELLTDIFTSCGIADFQCELL